MEASGKPCWMNDSSTETYCEVKGFEKTKKEIMIETAFRHVVTVTAAKAPVVLTSWSTIWIPMYPVIEKRNP